MLAGSGGSRTARVAPPVSGSDRGAVNAADHGTTLSAGAPSAGSAAVPEWVGRCLDRVGGTGPGAGRFPAGSLPSGSPGNGRGPAPVRGPGGVGSGRSVPVGGGRPREGG